MDISIIIVNYKTDKLVADCIASIKRNTKKIKYEIIVIDNSVDNRGFAKANNIGIKQAKGKYVLLLNSDTIVKPNSLDKLVEFAEDQTDAAAIVPRLLNENGSTQASVFRFPTLWGAIRQYFLGSKGYLDKYVPETQIVDVAVMAAFLITPQALKKIGMLNEKYFMYFEDFDYCRRIKEAGLKIYYDKDSEVIHLHGASGGTNKQSLWLSNKYLVDSAKKYHGIVAYYIYTFVLWAGQKLEKMTKR